MTIGGVNDSECGEKGWIHYPASSYDSHCLRVRRDGQYLSGDS